MRVVVGMWGSENVRLSENVGWDVRGIVRMWGSENVRLSENVG